MEKQPTEDSLIYRQRYTIRIHEINAAKLLTIPALLKLMQETSMQHLLALQASTWHMEEQQLGWVLLRQRLDILRPIAYGQAITIVTYPTGFDKFFGYRDYLVFDTDKKLSATATTMWSLIDIRTRRIARVPDQLRALSAPTDIQVLPRPEAKPVLTPEMLLTARHTVDHYDLDWNNHVNNVVLAQRMLAALLPTAEAESRVKSVVVHYKNESKHGDELSVYTSTDKMQSKLMLGDKRVAALALTLAEV